MSELRKSSRDVDDRFVDGVLREVAGGPSPTDLRARVAQALEHRGLQRRKRTAFRRAAAAVLWVGLGLGVVLAVWAGQQKGSAVSVSQQDPAPDNSFKLSKIEELQAAWSNFDHGMFARCAGPTAHVSTWRPSV